MKTWPDFVGNVLIGAALVLAIQAAPISFALPDLDIPVPFVPSVEPIVPGADGLQVLVIYETAPPSPLSQAQQAVIDSQLIRNYLNSECVKVDGRPVWGMFDKDQKFSKPGGPFSKALQRERDSIPWLIISNGSKGYEGPLPQNVTDMMALLKEKS